MRYISLFPALLKICVPHLNEISHTRNFMKYKNGRNNHQRIIDKLLTGNRGFIRYLKIRYVPVFTVLLLVTVFLCVITFPVTATIEMSSQPQTVSLQQGKKLYESGRFTESVKILQQVVKKYRNQGNELQEAVALSNLALVHQKSGNLTQAQQKINESLKLIEKTSANQNLNILAPILDIQGSIQLDLGQAEQALQTWQRSEEIYQQLNHQSGVLQARINQSQAWQVLGFYHRALTTLTELQQDLESQPDSITKAVELRALGDTLQLSGNLQQSNQVLQQSLKIAQKLDSPQDITAALFSLGNTTRAKQDFESAIALYQKAAAIAPDRVTKVQALINQFTLLANREDTTTAQQLLPQIQNLLKNLPVSQTSIYARIHLAQSLLKLKTKPEKVAREKILQLSILQLSNTAIKQAQDLGDKRAESFALGTLGNIYEKTKQFANAQSLTRQALNIALGIDAPDITYRWYWQLGRLLQQQGNIQDAIIAYDGAISNLQSLRNDLVSVNRDVQYSFKESVEPVYRESVALLLSSQNVGKIQQTDRDQKILDKARQRIEALQLAELDDYFRQACIDAQTVILDKVVDEDNPTAAIIYPIILPQQLQVIVKIPKQPLRSYTVNKSQKEIKAVLTQLREYLLESDRAEEVQALSQEVYGWLIENIESDLQNSGVKTLVFVLDGALRNVPMATLYDGQQYLIEKYAVALSLGLQLLPPKPIAEQPLQVIAAGLVEPPTEFKNFSPLPGITSEFDLISRAGVSTKQLLNQEFTSNNLEKSVNTNPFNVLHLATHGQFSSRPENTFILAADGAINVNQFDSLLRRRDEIRPEPLEMLVLSACQTATGDNRATLGLAGVSLKAGARSTLASLWHISDRSTAVLMGEFYRQLATSKVTKAEALRRAQVKLLKKYPNYEYPAFWAPYVLVGNWL